MNEENYIAIEDVANQLRVERATVYYYMRALKIERIKFDLDKRKYILRSDFQRIKNAKDAAASRKGNSQRFDNAA